MKLSPLKINLLMHSYAIAAPFNHPNAPAYQAAKMEFLSHGLVDLNENRPCGYKLTAKGHALVNMLLATPLPEVAQVFIDPRTGNPV